MPCFMPIHQGATPTFGNKSCLTRSLSARPADVSDIPEAREGNARVKKINKKNPCGAKQEVQLTNYCLWTRSRSPGSFLES